MINNTVIKDNFWNNYKDLVTEKMIPYQWNVLNDNLDIKIEKERNDELKRILDEAKTMQRVCYDPYVFATKDLGSDKMEYTCLVCGKNVGGSIPGHIVNLVEDGLIEGDHVAEYAVEQLKKYLVAEPALSEAEIREALRKDLTLFVKQR